MKAIRLAKLTGVSRSNISHITSGTAKTMQGPLALKIASVLAVSPEWLLTGKGLMRLETTSARITREPSLKASDPKVLKPLTAAQKALLLVVQTLVGQVPDEQAQAITKLIQQAAAQSVVIDSLTKA